MLSRIIVTGRTPYRVEYSLNLIKNGVSSYENPYRKLYDEPFAQYDRYENYYTMDYQEYKKERLIRQYRFYDSYMRHVPAPLRVNLVF